MKMNKFPLTSAPAVGVISLFRLNLTVQTFGWFVSRRDRSDPAACAEHYRKFCIGSVKMIHLQETCEKTYS